MCAVSKCSICKYCLMNGDNWQRSPHRPALLPHKKTVPVNDDNEKNWMNGKRGEGKVRTGMELTGERE